MKSQLAGDERIAYSGQTNSASPLSLLLQLFCKHRWRFESFLPGVNGLQRTLKRCPKCKKGKAFSL